MAPSSAARPAGRAPVQKSRIWWFASLENSDWGYDRMVGALANLGHQVFDQTVGNILRRHGIAPVPERSQTTTWKEFIRRHGLLHGRGAHLARTGDVLRSVFHSPGQPQGLHCWHHRSSGDMLDASGSLQCNI
jgi:hypothetical protein